MTTSSIRTLGLALMLLGAGVAIGYFGRRGALGRGKASGAERTAWTNPLKHTSAGLKVVPRRTAEDEAAEALGALGYAESYEKISEAPGVTQYRPDRAWRGTNLIVSAHEPTAILADMQGEELHRWSFAFADLPGEQPDLKGSFRRVELLPDGDLLAIFDYYALIRLDRDSKLKWSLAGGFHHDLQTAADGTIFVLDQDMHVMPRFDPTSPTIENFITHVSPEGQVLDRWSIVEAFENSPYASYLDQASKGGDIFHTNTLEILDGSCEHISPVFAAGRALISVRQLDVVAIVDLERNSVVWALSGLWHHQHQPVLLENGNLLVFDNLGGGEYSRVLEVEPFTQRLVWSFAGNAANDFFSQVLGSCQRLPNGNTLITESLRATAFEVTPQGETVWRYVSPYRFDRETDDLPVLMEVVRLGPDTPLDWLDAGAPQIR